ncbi:hypothetical protein [Paenibacillus sp. FSL H3-0333]|uniref:hypothetical protein n=1 Tax=Paenibacillus sp. FSL H3-0333 TaxID=2921373 RepID=UPI0030FAA11F
MENWQKLSVIIAVLSFIRLIIKDIAEVKDKRKKVRKKKTPKTSAKSRRRK